MIDWINTLLTSVSMSIDAMTVNATNGLKEKGMPLWKMALISFSYGLFQFIMPLIGYFVGYSFKEQLEAYIPWIAFVLLALLGVKSFIEWIKDFKKNSNEDEPEEKKIGFLEVLWQDVATAIDALCIGFVYLELAIGDALIVFGIIGAVTFVLTFLAVLLAKQLAKYLEKWAGLIAAIVFIGVGLKILLEGIL